jgi:hypothetical protein
MSLADVRMLLTGALPFHLRESQVEAASGDSAKGASLRIILLIHQALSVGGRRQMPDNARAAMWACASGARGHREPTLESRWVSAAGGRIEHLGDTCPFCRSSHDQHPARTQEDVPSSCFFTLDHPTVECPGRPRLCRPSLATELGAQNRLQNLGKPVGSLLMTWYTQEIGAG